MEEKISSLLQRKVCFLGMIALFIGFSKNSNSVCLKRGLTVWTWGHPPASASECRDHRHKPPQTRFIFFFSSRKFYKYKIYFSSRQFYKYKIHFNLFLLFIVYKYLTRNILQAVTMLLTSYLSNNFPPSPKTTESKSNWERFILLTDYYTWSSVPSILQRIHFPLLTHIK